MKPSQKQITAEIKKLTQMKPRVRRYSGFGDDHHAAIDAQVEVLKEAMDNDEIYDQDWSDSVRDSALQAMAWRDGDSKESPSSSWASLVS